MINRGVSWRPLLAVSLAAGGIEYRRWRVLFRVCVVNANGLPDDRWRGSK